MTGVPTGTLNYLKGKARQSQTFCPAKTCLQNQTALEFEQLQGVRLYREVEGQKLYKARCPACFQTYQVGML